MKLTLVSRSASRGFALPTVIIASVILLTVLVTAVTAVGSVTAALAGQYFNQLAREAAESGLASARACLRNSDYTATWTDGTPLKPNTDCNGTEVGSVSKWIVNGNNTRSSFSVPAPQAGAAGSLRVASTGTVELVRASDQNQVWRTYTYIGVETSRYNDTPQIAGGAGWKDGGHNGYMLAGNGVLYGWGDNSGQQLGDSSLGTTISTPIKVALPSGVSKAKKIHNSGQGASILCMLGTHQTDGDQVYCRGIPGGPEDGLMNHVPGWHRFALPAGLTALSMPSGGVNGLGVDSTCVKASDLQVYCAGENIFGQFGTGTTIGSVIPISSPVKFRLDLANPGPVSGSAASLTVQRVYNQDLSTCVIASDNQAYCAGVNNSGQLGQGNFTTNVSIGKSIPGRVLTPSNLSVTDVVQTYHNSAVTILFGVSDGTVYMSGNDEFGLAADGSGAGSCPASGAPYSCYSTPRLIAWGGFGRIISIGQEGGSGNSACAIGSAPVAPNSGLWCIGNDKFGQQGVGSCSVAPRQDFSYIDFGGLQVNAFMNNEATYQMNSLTIIMTNGDAYAAGDNTYGKLGTGAPLQTCNPTFAKVQLPAGVKAAAVANGDEYTTFILGDNGKVYAMGRNNNGQLGDGTTTNRTQPVEVKVPRQETVY